METTSVSNRWRISWQRSKLQQDPKLQLWQKFWELWV